MKALKHKIKREVKGMLKFAAWFIFNAIFDWPFYSMIGSNAGSLYGLPAFLLYKETKKECRQRELSAFPTHGDGRKRGGREDITI